MAAEPCALFVVPGIEGEVALRRNARARRLSLRIEPSGAVVLTVPPHSSTRAAVKFLESQRAWLADHLSRLPAAIPFVPGAVLPLRGTPHYLRHVPSGRRAVWAEAGVIHVSGAPAHFSRRVTDWLRREAHAAAAARAHAHAATLGRRVTRVGVRDTISRWGSCSASGALSFSWRLILAPDAVLDYVAAHEVAHLAERHHGPAFWALVHDLYPDFEIARAWLRREGAVLHRYGR